MLKRKPAPPKHPLGGRHTNKVYQGVLPYFIGGCFLLGYIFYVLIADAILNLLTPIVMLILIIVGIYFWRTTR